MNLMIFVLAIVLVIVTNIRLHKFVSQYKLNKIDDIYSKNVEKVVK